MIRPSYWTDSDLHTRLTAEQREFYIGLWMLADDEGYVSWDPARVGAELYPYRSPAWRDKRLAAWLAELGVEHAQLLSCGRHVVIPNLPRYQRPPKPSAQIKREHDACLRHMAPAGTKGHPVAPAQGFSRGLREEGDERGAPAGANADATMRGQALAAGGFAAAHYGAPSDEEQG